MLSRALIVEWTKKKEEVYSLKSPGTHFLFSRFIVSCSEFTCQKLCFPETKTPVGCIIFDDRDH